MEVCGRSVQDNDRMPCLKLATVIFQGSVTNTASLDRYWTTIV